MQRSGGVQGPVLYHHAAGPPGGDHPDDLPPPYLEAIGLMPPPYEEGYTGHGHGNHGNPVSTGYRPPHGGVALPGLTRDVPSPVPAPVPSHTTLMESQGYVTSSRQTPVTATSTSQLSDSFVSLVSVGVTGDVVDRTNEFPIGQALPSESVSRVPVIHGNHGNYPIPQNGFYALPGALPGGLPGGHVMDRHPLQDLPEQVPRHNIGAQPQDRPRAIALALTQATEVPMMRHEFGELCRDGSSAPHMRSRPNSLEGEGAARPQPTTPTSLCVFAPQSPGSASGSPLVPRRAPIDNPRGTPDLLRRQRSSPGPGSATPSPVPARRGGTPTTPQAPGTPELHRRLQGTSSCPPRGSPSVERRATPPIPHGTPELQPRLLGSPDSPARGSPSLPRRASPTAGDSPPPPTSGEAGSPAERGRVNGPPPPRRRLSGEPKGLPFKCVRRIGRYGNEPGTFQQPTRVSMSRDGTVVVSDRDQMAVQLFTTYGDFVAKFKVIGVEAACMWGSKDRLAVATHRGVEIYTPSGQSLLQLPIGRVNSVTPYKQGFIACKPKSLAFYAPPANTGDGEHTGDKVSIKLIKEICRRKPTKSGHFKKSTPFDNIRDVAVSKTNDILVLDAGTKEIYVIDEDGVVKATIQPGNESCGKMGDPFALTVDRWGNIFVSDSATRKVLRFSAVGRFSLCMLNFTLGATSGSARVPELTTLGMTCTADADHLLVGVTGNDCAEIRVYKLF